MLAAITTTLVVGLVAVFPAAAHATGAAGDGSGPEEGANQGNSAPALQEVVVSAQRRAERAQDVPITITNLDADLLKDANVQKLGDIAALTPALRFDNQGPFYQPTIRGVGTALVTTGSGSNVGIYVDGFYSPNPQAADTQLLNVHDIQVLKGPQGTLFGRNTTGGAILINTRKPSEQTDGMVGVSYARFNSQRYEAYGTTGLADHVAADVAGIFSKGDGFLHNIATGSDSDGAYRNWSIRTGLKIDPTDDISILFRYAHQSVDDPTPMENNAYVDNGQPLSLATVIPGAIVATRPGDVAETGHVGFTASNDIFQLTPTFDLGFGTLTSYSQYRRENSTFYEDGVASSVKLLYITVPIEDRTITQEILLTSKPGDRLQWTAGAFYFDYDDLFAANVSLTGNPFFRAAGSDSDTVGEAAFLDATYQIADKFYVTAGGRYSHDEVKDGYYYVGTGPRVYAPTLTGNRFTPRLVLRYTPNTDSSIYASFTRGYKAGMYNLGGDSIAPIRPETISAYEVGYKYAERDLSVDLSTYYYNYTNLQVASYGISAANVPYSEITNAANARIYGVEGQVRYLLLRDFEVSAGAAYLNAKYTQFSNSPSFQPCFSFPACGANYGMLIPTVTDARGFSMQRAPEFTATLGARYGLNLGGGRLSLSGNLYHTSKFYFDTSQQVFQEPYTTLALRAEWTNPSGRYSIAVYGDNVTDKRYLTQVAPNNLSAPASWSPPATVGAEIQVRFR